MGFRRKGLYSWACACGQAQVLSGSQLNAGKKCRACHRRATDGEIGVYDANLGPAGRATYHPGVTSEKPVAEKFDTSNGLVDEEEDTDPQKRISLKQLDEESKPNSVEAELRLLRASYQEHGKALGELQATTHRLEGALQQHGEQSTRGIEAVNTRLDAVNKRLDETNKRLDSVLEALLARADKPSEPPTS